MTKEVEVVDDNKIKADIELNIDKVLKEAVDRIFEQAGRPRDLQITKPLLIKHGDTDDCKGCAYDLYGGPKVLTHRIV